MTELQQFYDARDLWHTVEPDIVAGSSRTIIHAGFWRARLSLIAAASISPIKAELYVPSVRVYMTCKANATVLPA